MTRKAGPKPGSKPARGKPPSRAEREAWRLRLYVAGQTPRSLAALSNLRRLCAEYLPAHCTIEIIDLVEKPQLARGDQILAIPTLVRNFPAPMRKIIGDLSNTERVLVGLDWRPEKPEVTP